MHPSSINRLVNEGKGGSVDLIEKVEKMLNEPKGTILGYGGVGPLAPRFRDFPGFAGILDEAAKRASENKIQVTRQDLENAGDFRISPLPERLNPDLLIQLALSSAGSSPGKTLNPRRKK